MPAMGEDYIGREDLLEFLEAFFDCRTKVRKESIWKGFNNNSLVPCAAEEGVGAALGFLGAGRIGTKHEPVDLDALRLLDHSQYRATAADLDVVTVRPQAEHPLHAVQIARNHFLISC